GQFKKLAPNQEPKANFTLADEKLVAVYEYCNLHGLWVYEAK
ncbi:MAG: desulfoferrodoxin family protein, partial [Bacilli bacterium]